MRTTRCVDDATVLAEALETDFRKTVDLQHPEVPAGDDQDAAADCTAQLGGRTTPPRQSVGASNT